MIIKKDIDSLDEFDAWQGGYDTKVKICDAGKGEAFIQAIEDQYPDGIGETELNDLLWFSREFCLSLVGLSDDEEKEDEENDE